MAIIKMFLAALAASAFSTGVDARSGDHGAVQEALPHSRSLRQGRVSSSTGGLFDAWLRQQQGVPPPPPPGCSPDAVELVRLVNEYRAQNGRPAIPLSTSMCQTGDAHVRDSIISVRNQSGCTLTSWSDCCLSASNPQCMWDKPSQFTCYPGLGFENAYYTTNAAGASPREALDNWKNSAGTRDVLLNSGGWSGIEFNAMGAGLGGGYAYLWFGREADCQ